MNPTQLLNIFAPESTPARTIVDLSTLVLSVTTVIFVVVAILLVYVLLKFRATPANADREPAQVYGSTQIELAWTIIPVLIVLVLVAATARVTHAIQDATQPPTAVEVTVIGHQFWWEYRYPALGVVTANELHIPVSDPSRPRPTFLTLLSADTDHSFWIPQLAGKTDLIPNRVNRLWMDPQRPGIFLGQCAQYCGTQHAKMLQRVSVDTPDEFDAWIRGQQEPAIEDASATAGRRVFETTASGAAQNTPENLRLWLGDPDAIKPGSLMPAMKLSDAELDGLVRYMQSLR
jgi:cytochrome c oxidase subunit 2